MREQEPTRREREGGAETVSLNAIARRMAMSAPALYRYFASRDELLADLAVDNHLALADALDARLRPGGIRRVTGRRGRQRLP